MNLVDVSTGVVANAIFLGLLVLLGSGWLWWRRRRLLGLFKVSNSTGLTVLLSRLEILPGGAIGFDGMPRSFEGPAVTATEAAAASALGNLFQYLIPGLDTQPGLLKALFVRNVSVLVVPSPLRVGELPNDRTIVAVGSPGYNSVSAWFEQDLNPLIRFSNNHSSLISNGQQPVTDPTQGMVQVLWDANHQRRVFYLAGMSEAGTVAAILYLGHRWDELRRNLGNRQTYACYVRLKRGKPTLLTTV